jgi:hypothetical protein
VGEGCQRGRGALFLTVIADVCDDFLWDIVFGMRLLELNSAWNTVD